MGQEWLSGGTAAVDGAVIEGLGDLRRASGARVQAACERPVGLAVVGDCPVTQEELRAALPAVRVGRWAELTRWPGSYWVVADNGRQRFVCGDLAGIRAVYYTLRGDEGAAWASQARLLEQDRRLTPDLPLLAARLTVGEHHWPHRTPYERIRVVPGGFGLLVAPEAPPQLVDVTGVDPVNEPAKEPSGSGRR